MQKDKGEEPQLTYQTYVQNYKRRTQLRKENFTSHEQDILGGGRKTAQIKIIQKFIGKFKTDPKNYETILLELDTLNMSKYLEQVSNIIASSINQKQIHFYTQVATKLNTSYENVPAIMIKDLVRTFSQLVDYQEDNNNSSNNNSKDNKTKIKALFLYTVELFVCGFSFSYKEVLEMIKKVFKCGRNKKVMTGGNSEVENKLFIYCYSCTIFSAFLAHFSEIFTKRDTEWGQKWKQEGKQLYKYPEVLPLKTKDELTSFFSKYAQECFTLLKQVAEILKKYEAQLFECLRLDGQFNKETQKSYVEIAQKYTITRKHLKIISAAISEQLELGELDIKLTTIPEIMARYIDKAENAIIFEDEFQKQIYEGIPELVTSQAKNTTDEQYKEFKSMLDNCKNVNDSNQIAKAFNHINNKKNRKLLAKDILEYRKQYHLVTPYLCRVATIINFHYRDIGQTINDLIFSEYDKIKDTQSGTFVIHDKKSRIMKYICEFTKFGVIDADKTMTCIEGLIDNLNGFNIQLLISMLENCGRFLHLSEGSANKFTFLMKKYENIIKKKSLPILTTSQLINSINMLKPRKELEKQHEKQHTATQLKAQKIMSLCIMDKIDQLMNQIDEIVKTEQGLNAIKVAFLRRVESFDFMNSYNYAYLLEELKYKELTGFVVERTVQNLLLYLAGGENQRTILWAKFLAELFNYKLLDRGQLFSTLENVMKITTNQVGVIHCICQIFDACSEYIDSKKISKKNQKFFLLVAFKKYISKCKYVPMLEEYDILELYDRNQPDLASIEMKVLGEFMDFVENKGKTQGKELCYSDELDRYLSKKNLKKFQPKPQNKDTRGQSQSPEKTPKPETETLNLIQQSKSFDKQLTNIMQQNRKDYSSRIAKPMYLEKVFDKKKQKKKEGPYITVIGRSGNRFIRKDITKEEKKIQ